MDINDVINLTAQAADNVLGFRVIAFGSRAFIDLKAFTTTIRTSIRALAKDKDFSDDMPLACVVELAGTAAFRAAKRWNSIAEKKNHVDGDWFRSSVTSLVGGVVSEIGHQAHHQLQDHDQFHLSDEYLELVIDSGDGLSAAEQTTQQTPLPTPRSIDVTSYYGLEPASTAAARHDSLVEHLEPLPLRHQMSEAWRAVTKYAANPLSRAAADECEATIATLAQPRKRSRPDDDDDDDDDVDNDLDIESGVPEPELEQEGSDEEGSSEAELGTGQPAAKRLRIAEGIAARRSPATTSSCSRSPSTCSARGDADDGYVDAASQDAGGQLRKVSNGTPWTREEERLLVSLRDKGTRWDVIRKRLNRVSRGACQSKYYSLQDKRNNVDEPGGSKENSSSPGSGESQKRAKRMPRL